jgi:translation initiation factor 2 alpha subunit (eIF-2alpha)
MSEIETKTGLDVLVDLNLSKVKPKLKRKIVKQLKKKNLQVKIYVDVYSAEEGLVDVFTDAVATLKPKKRKKNKKK